MSTALAAPNETAIPLYLVEPDDMEAVRETLAGPARAWIEANGFTGRLGEVMAAPDENGRPALALVGWGDAAARARASFPLSRAAQRLPAGTYRIETDLSDRDAEEAVLGWLLAGYAYARFRKGESSPPRRLAPPASVDADRIEAIAEGVFLTRDLVNAPANAMGPAELEAAARELAERWTASVSVIEGDALLQERLPLIHAVGRSAAASSAPRLIDLRWGRAAAALVTIVGKGVCFDTGGLDLKPAQAMRLMKKDMGGAATALGLAHMIMSRHLNLRLRLLIPAVENVVAADAFRPGDVLESRAGLTVEVSNTDAEGRLVLADALALACEEKPELLIDFATLTGAARVALGPDLPALFTDDEALATDLAAAGAAAADPTWRLPLWPGYEADVKSDIADLDNAPSGGFAGSITAALFLKRFAETARSWAHFDVYAWTPKPKPGRPVGGELQAGRAVFSVLEARYG